MFTLRHRARSLALACTTAALVAPAATHAMPAPVEPPVSSTTAASSAPADPQPVVREIRTGDDTTIALVISGAALLLAAGGAALSGHDHRRIGRVA
jgi:hypothetical protein